MKKSNFPLNEERTVAVPQRIMNKIAISMIPMQKIDRKGFCGYEGSVKLPEGTITIWCRGSSGAIIAGIISSKLKGRARVAYISKPNEKRHDLVSPYKYSVGYNIIVDDFICTGKTIDDIIKKSDREKFDLLIVSGMISKEFIKSKSWDNIFETICCQKS